MPENADDRYQVLKDHVKKLLSKAEKGFAGIKKHYLLYLIYLIATNDYKKKIDKTDTGLQLLLSQTDKFWLCPNINSPDIYLKAKRNLIKNIILNELVLFINNNIFLKTTELQSFINNKTVELTLNETDLSAIFKHNLDFAHPRQRQQYYINSITAIALSVSTGLLGLRTGLELGQNYINYLLENENTLLSNLNFLQRRTSFYFKATLGSLIAAADGMAIYKMFYKYIEFIDNYKGLGWENLSIPDFVNYCSEDATIALFVPTNSNIDSTWFCKPQLPAARSPILFRSFLFSEINRLKSEIDDHRHLSKLLTCVMLKTPPMLIDIPYSLPIDILRNPQKFWTIDTTNKYNSLLQKYAELAIIDYINENPELKTVFDASKIEKLNAILATKKQELRQEIKQIDYVPSTSTVDNYGRNLILFCAFLTTIHALAFKYQLSDIKEPNVSALTITLSIISRFSALRPEYVISAIGAIYLRLQQLKDSFLEDRANKNSCKMSFFTTNAMKEFPKLKEVFEEPTQEDTSSESMSLHM